MTHARWIGTNIYAKALVDARGATRWVDALGAFRSALDHAVAAGRMDKVESAKAWKWARSASAKEIDKWRNWLGQQELAAHAATG